MIGLLQRVSSAKVEVGGACIAEIEAGLLVLVAVEAGDGDQDAERLAERLCGYRVFADAEDKMNLNVIEAGGALLLVPQFTLAADTAKGMRPSFHPAADPQQGQRLFMKLVECTRNRNVPVRIGEFGATMRVSLVNNGPVTFWLRTKPQTYDLSRN